jgi:hypothetical protein
MSGKNGRVSRHDQECTPRNPLDVAAETENEARDKIYDARGLRMGHVFQVDDYRYLLAVVITDGGGIPEVSQTHYRDLSAVAHGKLATRDFTVAMNLAEILGSIPGVALHCAGLRRYEPVYGCPSGQTVADDSNRSKPDWIRL